MTEKWLGGSKLFNTLYLVFVFIFFLPNIAFAYLDPGTGNALVYIVLSFLGALIFSLKGVFYAIIGRNDDSKDVKRNYDIVIFSEGKNYWNTFKPIVEALIKRKQSFTYYTMDFRDPCLGIDNQYINNKYIGKGNVALAKIGNLKTDLLLATTPNIGTPGYPIPRSKKIKKLIHVFHAIDGIAYYQKFSLDCYDAIMLVGKFEIPIIRKLEELRNLPAKELVPAGLPYLDVIAGKMQDTGTNTVKKEKKTILVAPSWGSKSCLVNYGDGFIKKLAEAHYRVIVRPHPQSMIAEKELITNMQHDLAKYTNVIWDFAVDGSKSMSEADLLVSDTSAIRFDFAVLYQKPVLTLEMPLPDPEKYELSDLKVAWDEQAINEIGQRLSKTEIGNIAEVVNNILQDNQGYDLAAFRANNIYNWEKSGDAIAEYLITKNQEYQQQRVEKA